jgi:hypothetical protein
VTGRHHVSAAQRQWVEERSEALADAVPPNMVEGLRTMLGVALASGFSTDDAYASVTEAMRAFQRRIKPHSKQWLVLESGCLWLERERKKEAMP